MSEPINVLKLRQWAMLVKAANESSLSRREWCRSNEISESSFYYWQKRVRAFALSSMIEAESSDHTQEQLSDNDFFEITVSDGSLPVHAEHNEVTPVALTDQTPLPMITIHAGRYDIGIHDNFSKQTLASVLEVINNV